MVSQKNSRLKHCIKCRIRLNSKNWLKYLVKRSNYICTPCFRQYGQSHYPQDRSYNKKQRDRYRTRRSAVIFCYGNQCVKCGEEEYGKLIICHIGTDKSVTNNVINHLYDGLINKEQYQVLCYNCSKKPYKDIYALRDKKMVIEHYGYSCIHCQEDRIERLTLSNKKKSGIAWYRWLIKHNYPDDLQVICYSCYHYQQYLSKIDKFID